MIRNQADDLLYNIKCTISEIHFILASLILIFFYGKKYRKSTMVSSVEFFLAKNTWGVLKMGFFHRAP